MHTYANLDTELALDITNRFVEELPGDPVRENYRRQVEHSCFSLVEPIPVSAPLLASFSKEAAALLDLDERTCRSPGFLNLFSGNKLSKQLSPYGMCYGGHQFGNWAGQLGDGRAINLGDIKNQKGEYWTLQLKGAGPTPYSRSADGLAVLRSSLREYICSEAMHHLGIPTTRALSLVLTGDHVVRDMFYDGNPKIEPGAVVCRLSPSFIRFGNFEIHASRKEHDLLQKLINFTIKYDFPHLSTQPKADAFLAWFAEVCEKTAEMIVHWMRVGFVHGVMNTDNMSILGLTIDYGPYGWLEGYDPSWTPNTTDAQTRRYCYGNQPYMAQWNLSRLAAAIQPLIGETKPLQEALDVYRKTFQVQWQETIAHKLGFFEHHPEDDMLITGLLELLTQTETDMTIFFRLLADFGNTLPSSPPDFFKPAWYAPDKITDGYLKAFKDWGKDYIHRLKKSRLSPVERKERMNRINPKFVFRNYLAQQAIDLAEQHDFSMIEQLMDVLKRPYDDQPENEIFAEKRPEWARNKPGCSMLSCSS